MSEVDELQARIVDLPAQDLAKLRDWLFDLDEDLWDRQISADFRAGKFKSLIDDAREELARGEAREL